MPLTSALTMCSRCLPHSDATFRRETRSSPRSSQRRSSMRSQKLIPALALAVGLTVPAVVAAAPTAGATTSAVSCSVEFYDLDASAVDEIDGKDELRLEVGSRIFPSSWVNMN